jgi:hypothetical protein
MTSLRQIEANRRNAQMSTGPSTEEGKRKSRQNAVRHGLTAETVIDVLEDAEDYAAFELAVTSDYDAQSAVERELVLRLASLLWRLRRATSIEAGLFEAQTQHLFESRGRRQHFSHNDRDINSTSRSDGDLVRAFVRLNRLSTCPLDRLSRYEAALWRQACQVLFTLQCLTRRKPWAKLNRL